MAGVVVGLMAYLLARPPRMTDGKAAYVLKRLSPGDLGLRFEELRLAVPIEGGRKLDVAAWWVPAEGQSGRCVVLLHGYADAKVGAIAWGPAWHELGYHLLVPDLRGHGESGGKWCTGGYFERHDISHVIDQVKQLKPRETAEVVLFGASLGAAVAAATADLRNDVAAVVMESPFADFRHAAIEHMERLGLPGRAFQRAAVALAEWTTGANYDAVRPRDVIARLACPVLLIESGEDHFVTLEDRAALERAAGDARARGTRAEVWKAPGAPHLMAVAVDPAGYREALARFLDYPAQGAGGYARLPVQPGIELDRTADA